MISSGSPDGKLRLFGRRSGRRLRKGRQALVDTLLPRLRLQLPDGAENPDIASYFPPSIRDLWLEVGFGGGEHLAALAHSHPDTGFIGCEPFIEGVANLLSHIDRGELSNIRIFDDDARLLLAALPEASIGRVYVLFNDPWPKKRHHKRRFMTMPTLDSLARLLRDGAELRFASDHMEYVRWTLERLTNHDCFAWTATSSRDWRQRPPQWHPTRYETKALEQGRSCVYLVCKRRPRPGFGNFRVRTY